MKIAATIASVALLIMATGILLLGISYRQHNPPLPPAPSPINYSPPQANPNLEECMEEFLLNNPDQTEGYALLICQ